ncbi:hypothetical protein IEQ34_001637 [Dendrobium chrysotoxum]|uniref:Uncharacterized protein n=1 Tax=Dendrobium chrysotoxum TaxID=161865 RepID=A0AAV7HP76_DENCH|nr:hypothetical protein IEQ34_001637 [Dendrobium chrysotoxum]
MVVKRLKDPSFLDGSSVSRSFKEALSGLSSSSNFFNLKITSHCGMPFLWISEDEIHALAVPFEFSLVGKFPVPVCELGHSDVPLDSAIPMAPSILLAIGSGYEVNVGINVEMVGKDVLDHASMENDHCHVNLDDGNVDFCDINKVPLNHSSSNLVFVLYGSPLTGMSPNFVNDNDNAVVIDVSISLISNDALNVHLALSLKVSCVDQSDWLEECFSSDG